MIKKSIIYILAVFSFYALGLVDTKNANYTKTFRDISLSTQGLALMVERTYNSRSLYNGMFGFGWCSNIETKLTVLPDETIKVVECGGGMEILYHPKGKVPDINFYVESILSELQKRKIKLSPKKLAQLKKDLETSQNLRSNFIETLNIRGTASKGLKYYAKGRSKEFIIVTEKGYLRRLPNDLRERFNQEGRLVESKNRNTKIEISWSDTNVLVMDERGNRLNYLLNKDGKVKQARYNKKPVATYTHKGDNLIRIVNHSKETYRHSYDGLSNLTRTVYPDATTEELSYNTKKDWVMSFKDRRGCKESYNYGVNNKNPDHYFSTVQKVCGKRIVNKSKYEFWHARDPGGGKYLKRARSRINGRIDTDVSYHPLFGSPTSLYKNGVRTRRNYYGNGFLKQKDNIFQTTNYKKYNQKCLKPELVEVAYKDQNNSDRIVRREKINFKFDNNCQLLLAKKSNDEWIRITPNKQGQIASMEDQSRKKIELKWHPKFNKPYMLTRKGVGSIRIVYSKDGSSIERLQGLEKDPTVVTQVTSVFSNFLTVLGPVAEEMAIL